MRGTQQYQRAATPKLHKLILPDAFFKEAGRVNLGSGVLGFVQKTRDLLLSPVAVGVSHVQSLSPRQPVTGSTLPKRYTL